MLVALAANVAVGVSKLLGFLLTGSVALLAECLHSLADSGNQGLLLLGARRARAAPTQERPFGRGRERYFWAFVVGLILFGLGGVVSIIEGVRKLGDPSHGVDHAAVALTLIGVAALFEASSLRVGVRAARRSIRAARAACRRSGSQSEPTRVRMEAWSWCPFSSRLDSDWPPHGRHEFGNPCLSLFS